MRNYETVFIMDPSLGDDKAAEEITKARSVVESASGEIISVQKWGKRKLAYEIMKRREGIYAVIKFRGDGAAVSELERNFRLSEPVIRFMTVVDNNPPSEAEEAEAESTEEAPATTPAGETAPAAETAVDASTPEAEEGGPAGDVTASAETAGDSDEKSPAAAAPEVPSSEETLDPEGEGSTTAG